MLSVSFLFRGNDVLGSKFLLYNIVHYSPVLSFLSSDMHFFERKLVAQEARHLNLILSFSSNVYPQTRHRHDGKLNLRLYILLIYTVPYQSRSFTTVSTGPWPDRIQVGLRPYRALNLENWNCGSGKFHGPLLVGLIIDIKIILSYSEPEASSWLKLDPIAASCVYSLGVSTCGKVPSLNMLSMGSTKTSSSMLLQIWKITMKENQRVVSVIEMRDA